MKKVGYHIRGSRFFMSCDIIPTEKRVRHLFQETTGVRFMKRTTIGKLTSWLAIMMLALTMIMMSACGQSQGSGAGEADDIDDSNGPISGYDGVGENTNVAAEYEDSYNPDKDYDLDHHFKNHYRLEDHFERHGEDMGFETPEEYEWAADQVIHDEDALHKLEKEDGDDVYYLPETNEFVIVSPNGIIRTYFSPDSGIHYFNKQ